MYQVLLFSSPREARRASIPAREKRGTGDDASFECTLMAGKFKLPSAAISLQFLSSFTAAHLSSLMSGTERTARAHNKVSTDRLNLIGGALL